MPGIVTGGPVVMGGAVDPEGYRTYRVTFPVLLSDPLEGPAAALQAVGLPFPGSPWFIGNDVDVWVWFRPEMEARLNPDVKRGDRAVHWEVDMTASNKPTNAKRCHDQQIDDPLLEPQQVSGGSVTSKEEATIDKDGFPIQTPLGEQIHGDNVVFPVVSGQVKVKQNVPLLEDNDILDIMNHSPLNDSELWGYPARCVRLSDFQWVKIFYGQCYVYYERHFTFDILKRLAQDPITGTGAEETVSGWDRDVIARGTMILRGRWDVDRTSSTYGKYILAAGVNPTWNPNAPISWPADDIIQYQDPHGNLGVIVYSVDYPGLPVGVGVLWDGGSFFTSEDPFVIRVKKHGESDLTALGIPLSY